MMSYLAKHVLAVGTVFLLTTSAALAQPNILTNGDFEADLEGTFGGGTDVVDTGSITGWRVFGVGGQTGTATVTSAAGRSGQGIELARQNPLGSGDSAFDKDDPALRDLIPAEERIYKLTVDARDGGVFGGTPELRAELQFTDTSYNRAASFDPEVEFETFGLTARSDAAGTISARFNLGPFGDQSAHFDNATLVDATSGVNRLVNGGFENSATRMLNWRFFDTTGFAGTATLSDDANSGERAALLSVTSDPTGGDIGLDFDPFRVATIGGEELTLSFAAKNVEEPSADTRLRATVAGFDIGGNFVSDFVTELVDAGNAYEQFSFTFQVPDEVAQVNVGFRVWNEVTNGFSTGSYLIDDVSLLRAAAAVAGDYNGNGIVDAADYTVWRDTLGSTTDLRANGDDTGASAGVIDDADYVFWKTNFGSIGGGGAAVSSAVPEPTALLLVILGATLTGAFRRRVRVGG